MKCLNYMQFNFLLIVLFLIILIICTLCYLQVEQPMKIQVSAPEISRPSKLNLPTKLLLIWKCPWIFIDIKDLVRYF